MKVKICTNVYLLLSKKRRHHKQKGEIHFCLMQSVRADRSAADGKLGKLPEIFFERNR